MSNTRVGFNLAEMRNNRSKSCQELEALSVKYCAKDAKGAQVNGDDILALSNVVDNVHIAVGSAIGLQDIMEKVVKIDKYELDEKTKKNIVKDFDVVNTDGSALATESLKVIDEDITKLVATFPDDSDVRTEVRRVATKLKNNLVESTNEFSRIMDETQKDYFARINTPGFVKK